MSDTAPARADSTGSAGPRGFVRLDARDDGSLVGYPFNHVWHPDAEANRGSTTHARYGPPVEFGAELGRTAFGVVEGSGTVARDRGSFRSSEARLLAVALLSSRHEGVVLRLARRRTPLRLSPLPLVPLLGLVVPGSILYAGFTRLGEGIVSGLGAVYLLSAALTLAGVYSWFAWCLRAVRFVARFPGGPGELHARVRETYPGVAFYDTVAELRAAYPPDPRPGTPGTNRSRETSR